MAVKHQAEILVSDDDEDDEECSQSVDTNEKHSRKRKRKGKKNSQGPRKKIRKKFENIKFGGVVEISNYIETQVRGVFQRSLISDEDLMKNNDLRDEESVFEYKVDVLKKAFEREKLNLATESLEKLSKREDDTPQNNVKETPRPSKINLPSDGEALGDSVGKKSKGRIPTKASTNIPECKYFALLDF